MLRIFRMICQVDLIVKMLTSTSNVNLYSSRRAVLHPDLVALVLDRQILLQVGAGVSAECDVADLDLADGLPAALLA